MTVDYRLFMSWLQDQLGQPYLPHLFSMIEDEAEKASKSALQPGNTEFEKGKYQGLLSASKFPVTLITQFEARRDTQETPLASPEE